MNRTVFGITVLTVVALGGLTKASQASQVKVPVVAGAKALSTVEKGQVDGRAVPVADCPPPPPLDCIPVPCDTKPGYGFGTTGHYGPPGQGFTTAYSWRAVVAGGLTTTLRGKSLPPRAFK
jgi:hypothetical protein